MSEGLIPDHQTSEDMRMSPIEIDRYKMFGDLLYHPEYDLIAYKCLANSTQARSKSHVCAKLRVSKPTLLTWMKKHPSFNNAIVDGLKIGSVKWKNKIAKHAWQPSGKVNNGLIKLLSASVYGIKEEADAQIIINNNVETDPEKLMKNRGIPIPKVDVEDIDD